MLNLLRKEFLTTRRMLLIACAAGFALLPAMKSSGLSLYIVFFAQFMFAHFTYGITCQSALSRPNNLLLNSLPATRRQIVDAKYLYLLLCILFFATYLTGICLLLGALGAAAPIPLPILWAALAFIGFFHHTLLLPVSYLDARYGTWAGMAVYALILLLPALLGRQKAGPAINAFLTRAAAALNGSLTLLVLIAALLVLYIASLLTSRRLYKKMEF